MAPPSLVALAGALAALSPSTVAAWPTDPEVNVLVSGAAVDEIAPVVATDGAGGLHVVWADARTGTMRARIQHVGASGELLWSPPEGRLASDDATTQEAPRVLADGTGGAIVVWSDDRLGPWRALYAQRFDAAGNRLWSASGVCLAADTLNFEAIGLVPGPAGGALVAMYGRNAVAPYAPELSMVAVSASGTLEWGPARTRLRTAGLGGYYAAMLSPDDSRGALFAWHEFDGTHFDIVAQRVTAAGALAWGPAGVRVAPPGADRFSPSIVRDGSDGAIVEWHDLGALRVKAQRLGPSAERLWGGSGVVLWAQSETAGDTLVADGAGGAYAVRGRFGAFVRHLAPDGTLDWNGDSLRVNPGVLRSPPAATALSSSASGGGDLLVAWTESAMPPAYEPQQIRVQKVTRTGTLAWGDSGAVMSRGPHERQGTAIVSDGAGGVLGAWSDRRSGTDADLYAQRVAADGTLPNTGAPVADDSHCSLTVPTPHPARPGSGATLLARLDAGEPARVAVLDVGGRVRRVLLDAPSAAGTHGPRVERLHWDGLGGDGARLPAGLYFVLLRSGARTAARRVVLLE